MDMRIHMPRADMGYRHAYSRAYELAFWACATHRRKALFEAVCCMPSEELSLEAVILEHRHGYARAVDVPVGDADRRVFESIRKGLGGREPCRVCLSESMGGVSRA